MRFFFLAWLLTAAPKLDAGEVASVLVNDLHKEVRLQLVDGREVAAPRAEGHRWQMDPSVRADRKCVGWLVGFEGQANEARPTGVAVLCGTELRTLKLEGMIWRWAFYRDTLVVALGPERPHEPAEYRWYALPNFALLGSMKRFELNEYDAAWAHAARLRTRLE